MENKNYKYFYILTFALFIAITAPNLFSQTMFMDGIIYASISRNMALGLGTFWTSHFSDTLSPIFYGHPPLALGLESLWFKIFGDSIYVERFYSLSTFIIVGLLIALIWKEITNEIKFAWIPLFFWIIIPIVSWACANNILENTMSVFITLSALLYLKSLKNKRFIYLILSGIVLSMAVLSKGFPALFIWILPFLFLLFNREKKIKYYFIDAIILSISTILPILLLYLSSKASATFMLEYFNSQIIKSIISVKIIGSRFYILTKFFTDIIPPILLSLLILFIAYKKKIDLKTLKSKYSISLIFFILTLAGVIPIMVTLKQRAFYISPVYPFFAIAISLILFAVIKQLLNKINTKNKMFGAFSYFLLFISFFIAVLSFNKYGKDEIQIKDCKAIIAEISKNKTISVCKDTWSEWNLHGYFERYGNISLAVNKKDDRQFFIINNNCYNSQKDKIYFPSALKTIKYKLYIKK